MSQPQQNHPSVVPAIPSHGFPGQTLAAARRRTWPWILAIAAFVAGFAILAGVVLSGNDDGPTTAPDVPTPITRAELMAQYARIAPLDKSATPESMDGLAVSTCSLLDDGVSTDRVISAGTEIYGAESTQVVHLLVSYRCPHYLKDFK